MSRGTLQVRQDSIPWRVYEEWRRNKGWLKTKRAQVDLCHFTRVFLIFGPWRWFWQSAAGPLAMPPVLYAALMAIVGFLVFAFDAWTNVMLTVLWCFGLTVAAVALVAGSVWFVGRNKPWFENAVERLFDGIIFVVDRILVPVLSITLFPIAELIGRGFSGIGDHVMLPAGRWVFQRPLFSLELWDELISFTPFGIYCITLFLGGLTLGFWLVPIWMGVGIGSLIALVLLIILLVKGVRRFKHWAESYNPPERPERTPRVKKDHPTRDVVWNFLVAKKHRICPLITPVAGSEEGMPGTRG